VQESQDGRTRGFELIDRVIDQLSAISAGAMSGAETDLNDLYTACGEMQMMLQQAMALLQEEVPSTAATSEP
jgi:hypothetical protein